MRERRVAIIDQNGLILNVIVFDDTIGCTLPSSGQMLIDAPDGGEPGGHFLGNIWFDRHASTPSSLIGSVVASSRVVTSSGVSSTSILNSTSVLNSTAIAVGP